jgi:L-lactate dehydrogenase complex protein LldG
VSEAARAAILGRLRLSGGQALLPVPPPKDRQECLSSTERAAQLRRMMEAVKTEFLEATPETWRDVVHEFLAGQRVLYPGDYQRPIEEWKSELFESVDAAVTTTRGAIAETGSLIVWPSTDEPRLMSLVPPMHVALLDVDAIFETFEEAMQMQGWAEGMPPNALLISGPSKTADIEQTLAYGVHGPKRLVVVLISPGLASVATE